MTPGTSVSPILSRLPWSSPWSWCLFLPIPERRKGRWRLNVQCWPLTKAYEFCAVLQPTYPTPPAWVLGIRSCDTTISGMCLAHLKQFKSQLLQKAQSMFQTYFLSSSQLPPPLLGKVCGHPLHLFQQVVPMRFRARSLLKLWQPP